MKLHHCDALKATMETEGRFQLTRHEVFEMHLFDTDAAEEEALCGADTSSVERRGVGYYLEDRLHGWEVGSVCEGCKPPAVRFAVTTSRDLEDEGLMDEAGDYYRLADRLARETGLDRTHG